jgi:hypothetical protein
VSLTREQILARNDRPIKTVSVGGDTLCVRSLSSRELIAHQDAIKAADGDREKALALQLAALICDEAGNRILSMEDALVVLDQSPALVAAIVKAGDELNGSEDVKGN